eukprot:11379242-Heterocapsa_arctica.AAC.1
MRNRIYFFAVDRQGKKNNGRLSHLPHFLTACQVGPLSVASFFAMDEETRAELDHELGYEPSSKVPGELDSRRDA